MSEVGQALQHVWSEAHQGRIVMRVVALTVQERLIKELPRMLKRAVAKLETQQAASKILLRDLETRLVTLEQRRGVRS